MNWQANLVVGFKSWILIIPMLSATTVKGQDSLFQYHFDELLVSIEAASKNQTSFDLFEQLVDEFNLRETQTNSWLRRDIGNNLFQELAQFNINSLWVTANLISTKGEAAENSINYFALKVGDLLFEEFFSNHMASFKITNEVYDIGFWCSVSGMPPKKMLELNELVSSQNFNYFLDWMNSLNLELRVYGAIGIMFSRFHYSHQIPPELTELANQILSEDFEVKGCEGCFSGNFPQSYLLDFSSLYQRYRDYADNGFIR